ncbi:MAG: hypothetical protein FWD42_04910 [Solirubrobacterales bacterium]|nr:hypothetical protein [Solirubrobacterales bacterium]
MTSPLLIADLPWLLYRSFFALPRSIQDGEGHPVGALLGTVNALLSAIEACAPRAVVACTGAEQARYRVELYPPYHAHRDPMPGELRWQWERAPALLAGFHWLVAGDEELEADDVMFSYARVEEEGGGTALLLTGDRDLFQAVTARVAVLPSRREEGSDAIGPAQVRGRYGVAPALVPDFIALRGDPSDGLPGAPGIGAKTAAALLAEHGSLEALLDDAATGLGRVRGRRALTLTEHAQQLRDFKRIATLVRVDLARPPDRATDPSGGAEAARALGMRRLAERLERAAAP